MNWIFFSFIPLLLLNGANSKAMYHFLSLHLLHFSEWNTICDKSLFWINSFLSGNQDHFNVFSLFIGIFLFDEDCGWLFSIASQSTSDLLRVEQWPASRSKQHKVNFKKSTFAYFNHRCLRIWISVDFFRPFFNKLKVEKKLTTEWRHDKSFSQWWAVLFVSSHWLLWIWNVSVSKTK